MIALKVGGVYRENRVFPVIMGATLAFNLNQRVYTVRGTDYVCALSDPQGKTGIFIDMQGNEHSFDTQDLSGQLKYIGSNLRKKVIPRFIFRRGVKDKFSLVLAQFYKDPSNIRKYGKWLKGDGTPLKGGALTEEVKEDEEISYKVGGLYKSSDGKFSFVVVAEKGGIISVVDLADEKTYDIQLSDLELCRPKFIEVIKEFTE